MSFNKVSIKSNSQKAIKAEIRRVQELTRTEPNTKGRARKSYLNRLYKCLEPIIADFGIEETPNGDQFVITDSKTGALID